MHARGVECQSRSHSSSQSKREGARLTRKKEGGSVYFSDNFHHALDAGAVQVLE